MRVLRGCPFCGRRIDPTAGGKWSLAMVDDGPAYWRCPSCTELGRVELARVGRRERRARRRARS